MARINGGTPSDSSAVHGDVCTSEAPDGGVPAPKPPAAAQGNSVDAYDAGHSDQAGQPAPGAGLACEGPTIPASSLRWSRAAWQAPPSEPSGGSSKGAPVELRHNSGGPAVVTLQRALLEAGLSVGPHGADGRFGNATEAAVRAFQKAHSPPLAETGVVDASTWAELQKASPKALKEGPPAVGDSVRLTADGTPMLWQNDPRWGSKLIGEKPVKKADETKEPVQKSIGAVGCLLTSVAMILSKRLGRVVTPDKLNEVLLRHGAFGEASIGSWAAVQQAVKAEFGVDLAVDTKNVRQEGRALAATVDRELAAGRPVILCMDTDGDGKVNHYVVVQRKEQGADGKVDYVVIDPAYGREFRYQLDDAGDLAAKDAYYHWRSFDKDGKLIGEGQGAPRARGVLTVKK